MGWFGTLLDLITGLVTPPRPTPAPTPPGPTPTPPKPVGLVAALDAQRRAVGLSPLAEDPVLDQLATSWAAKEVATGILRHGAFASRIAGAFPGRIGAEDIAVGQPDVKSVVAAWMQSPPHRSNILGPFTRVGVGTATTESTIYWVVDFLA